MEEEEEEEEEALILIRSLGAKWFYLYRTKPFWS